MRALTRRSLAQLRTAAVLPRSLRLLWLVGVLWCELGSYRFAVWICAWPDSHLTGASGDTTHVLVITDPQVRHPTAHKHPGFFPSLHDWFYHAGLSKSWKYVNNLRPDVVIFLGDMLASGRKVKDDDEYVKNYDKFRSIFPINRGVSVFHVPGNEDVGLNLHSEDAVHAQRRYSTHFGPLNSKASISNHIFIFINAPGLVEEDYQRARHHQDYETYTSPAGGSVDFLRRIGSQRDGSKEPVILFTHIPLSRPDNAGCGPLREHGAIRRGAGPGYQNMFGKQTSEFLLDVVKPARIFSGDDRDFCEYTHSRASAARDDPAALVREVTVKSFSPDKSIRRPGFHLLSLVPPAAHAPADPGPGGALPSLADTACALPAQAHMYRAFYAPLALLTLLAFLLRRVREHRARPHASPLPSFGPPPAAAAAPRAFSSGAHGPWPRWWRALFGAQRKRPARVKHDYSPSGGFASLVKAPSARVGPRSRAIRRVATLVLLDFIGALWPAFILWATAMWFTL